MSKPNPRMRLVNMDISLALLEVLRDYATYEKDKIDEVVADSGPRPVSYPFHLVGLFNYLEKLKSEATDSLKPHKGSGEHKASQEASPISPSIEEQDE